MTRVAAAVLVVAAIGMPRETHAYSVLAHQSNIDALWDAQIRPLLLAKYPRTSPDALLAARAYAYGGSVIQDMGYYPFGSHFFTNLLHYVKTGDLVEQIGPLKPLAFTVPTPEAEKLFLDSLRRSRERFGDELAALRRGNLTLANVNLDTGKPSVPGEYALADQTARVDERLLKNKLEASKGTKKSKNE